jgi:hypothetical protein
MYKNAFIKLQRNAISLRDSWFGIGEKKYDFYDVSKSVEESALSYGDVNLFEFSF